MTLVTAHGGNMVNLMHLDEETVRNAFLDLCRRGDVEKVVAALDEAPERARDILSSKLDSEGFSGLHIAASSGNVHLATQLLARGCQADARDRRMQSPLHIACGDGHIEVARELIAAACSINGLDENQQTALHRAVLLGAGPEVVRVLLENAADPKLVDATQATALLLAAGHGRADSVACLLERDPSLVHAQDANGWTALHLAAHGKEMKKSSVKNVKFLPAVQLLLQAKAPLEAVDEDSRTALHRAADTGNAETVAALLAARADVNASDITRWSPLHFAARDGHLQVAQQLLQAKAPVQREQPVCLTPLALATMENELKVAELLLTEGADPNLRAKGLSSAAMIARKEPEKYDEILALFELGYMSHTT